MAKFTKADIDGLVDAVPNDMGDLECKWFSGGPGSEVGYPVDTAVLRRMLYLAARLTAEGAPKPERVRCYLYRAQGQDEPRGIALGPVARSMEGWEIMPGTFVPDGAE